MRIFLLILGVFAAVVCFEKPAAAQNNAWCAYENFAGGATNCGFSTFQQCLAAVSGNSRARVDLIRSSTACRGPLHLGA